MVSGFEKLNGVLKRAVTAAVVCTPLAGCVTTGGVGPKETGRCIETNGFGSAVLGGYASSFNQKCADQETGRLLAADSNPEMKTLGMRILRKTSPAVEQAAQEMKEGKPEPKGPVYLDEKAKCTVRRTSADSVEFSKCALTGPGI